MGQWKRRRKQTRVDKYFQRKREQRRQKCNRAQVVKGVYVNVDGLSDAKIQDIQRILLRKDLIITKNKRKICNIG